jgi:hypothetical protein
MAKLSKDENGSRPPTSGPGGMGDAAGGFGSLALFGEERTIPTLRSERAHVKRTQTFCDVQPHLIMSKPTDEQRAALQMLATSHLGCSLFTGMARGFAYEMLQDLVRAGWANVQRDAVGAGKTKVPHLRITEAGRKVIAGLD